MEKRKWYNENIETSLLGFGAMRLKTIDGKIDEVKALELIDIAYKNGVNYFDTAYPYTNKTNEIFVGKALKRYPRESFYLATKLPINWIKSPDDVEIIFKEQLSKLQTEYIDFYLVHAMNKNSLQRLKEWDVINKLETLKKEGKIRHIGFSFHDSYEVFKDILDYYNWEFVQLQLNYMDRDIQQGIQGYNDLRERKIPVIVMEPVKGGKLADFNKEIAKDFLSYSSDSLAKWALRWVGSLDGVKVILSGMNELSQLTDNIDTFSNFKSLNNEEVNIVDGVYEKLKKVTKVGCTSCKYCMPCPQGVNIPQNFKLYNDYAMYNNSGYTLGWFKELKENNTSALTCVNCKVCISKCPQGINIPEEFKIMLSELDFLK